MTRIQHIPLFHCLAIVLYLQLRIIDVDEKVGLSARQRGPLPLIEAWFLFIFFNSNHDLFGMLYAWFHALPKKQYAESGR